MLLNAVRTAVLEEVGAVPDALSRVERIIVEVEKEGEQKVHVFLW